MTADVRRINGAAGEVRLLGGPGVGVVTQEGLGLPVGEAAINPVPRANITENVRTAAGSALSADGLGVTISVPGGEAMARKTLNARFGILGGVSILGTHGHRQVVFNRRPTCQRRPGRRGRRRAA